jgi:hypothetical protein
MQPKLNAMLNAHESKHHINMYSFYVSDKSKFSFKKFWQVDKGCKELILMNNEWLSIKLGYKNKRKRNTPNTSPLTSI